MILSQLRQDHADFALLLDAVEREVDAACRGQRPNLELLTDIISFFRGYLDTHHHMKEDFIYGILMLHMPAFGSNRIPVLEEHLHLADETARFERALLQSNIDDPTGRRMLCEGGRAFVAHERAHMKAEEELIFPSAEQWFKAEHWAEVDLHAKSSQNLERERTLKASLARLLEALKVQAVDITEKPG